MSRRAGNAATRPEGTLAPGKRLLATVSIMTVLLLALGISVVWRSYDREQEVAKRETTEIARVAAANADGFLDDRTSLLRVIGGNPAFARGKADEIRAYLESLDLAPGLFAGGLHFIDRQGRLQVTVNGPFADADSLGARLGVRWSLETGRPSIGTAILDRQGEPLVPVVVPVRDRAGRPHGAVVGMIRPAVSRGFRRLLSVSHDLVVIDRGGHVLFGEKPAPGFSPIRSYVARMLRARGSGYLEPGTDLGGVPGRVVGFATTSRGDWLVLENRDADELIGPIRDTAASELAVLLVGALIALAAAALVARRLDRAMHELERRRWYERRIENAASALALTSAVPSLAKIAIEAALDILPAFAAALIEREADGRLEVIGTSPVMSAQAPTGTTIDVTRALETQAPVWKHAPRSVTIPIDDRHVIVVRLSRATTDLERDFALALASRVRSALARAGLFNELQLAERSLRAQTGLLEAVANGTTDLIFAKDREGRFVMLNEASAAVLGTTVAEALGRREEDFVADDHVAESIAAERRVHATGQAESGERRFGADDESVFVVSRAPLRDEGGQVIGTVTVGHDITERTRMEEARSEALAREADARRRVELLQSVTAAFAQAATSKEIADTIVRESTRSLDAEMVAVLVEIDGVLRPLASDGFSGSMNIALDAELPQAAAYRTGETIVIESLEPRVAAAYSGLAVAPVAWSSAVMVPICYESVSTGVVVWASYRPRRFDEDFVRLAEAVASQAALAFERARLFEAERGIAVELQRSMLPSGLPDVPGAQFAARYEAGAEHLSVGGDWYEIIVLPSCRIGLVIGDVVGRGLPAAAAMAQLRSAVAALAGVTSGPGALLERLETFASQTDGAEFATVAVCVLDPATGLLRYACAAQPPPLVLFPDGRTTFLDDGRSPPLCALDGAHRPEGAVRLPLGSTLLLYTDGLVERRGEPLTARLERLRNSVSNHAGLTIERMGEEIIQDMIGDQLMTDDLALLITGMSGPPSSALSVRVLGTAEQVPVLRHRLRHWLTEMKLRADVQDDIILAAGEAVANAVEHAYAGRRPGPVDLTAWMADNGSAVCLEVADHGGWRDDGHDEDRGRGLMIMRSLLDSVDVVHASEGTSISMMKRTWG